MTNIKELTEEETTEVAGGRTDDLSPSSAIGYIGEALNAIKKFHARDEFFTGFIVPTLNLAVGKINSRNYEGAWRDLNKVLAGAEFRSKDRDGSVGGRVVKAMSVLSYLWKHSK